MKTLRLIRMIMAVALLFGAAEVLAATDTANLTVNATQTARAKLTLGVAAVSFADADPDTTASIGATENAVNVNAKVKTGASSTATLTVLAAGNLVSGTDEIAISMVTWTATGSGFVAGTMNKDAAQSAGSWTGSGNFDGTFSYFLANSWSYAAGSYSASVTYTLTAP